MQKMWDKVFNRLLKSIDVFVSPSLTYRIRSICCLPACVFYSSRVVFLSSCSWKLKNFVFRTLFRKAGAALKHIRAMCTLSAVQSSGLSTPSLLIVG